MNARAALFFGAIVAFLATGLVVRADGVQGTDGPDSALSPVPLFNGRDLTGWVNVNGAPDTWSVRDGMIVCSGQPKCFLRTEAMYENYVLDMEWRHTRKGGNAGVFVHADALPQIGAPYPRSVEVQVMDGDHGSIFGIRGCTLVPLTNPTKGKAGRARPTEDRCRPAGEWNRYVLTARDGALELEVNGKVVTRVKDCSHVRGYICLEAEGSEVEFRKLRLKVLPSSRPPVAKAAQADDGFRSLFNGLSFAGWRHPEEFKGLWVVRDGLIACEGPVKVLKGRTKDLWTAKAYRDFVLLADWRLPKKPALKELPTFTPDGLFVRDAEGAVVRREILDAGDSGIHLRGDPRYQVNIWSQPMGSGDLNALHKDATLPADVRRTFVPKKRADAPFGQWNRFRITLRGNRVTVALNGEVVIERAELTGVPPQGALGLQNHGDPVEFRNLFLKELPESTEPALK
jgi:hypothetical protein